MTRVPAAKAQSAVRRVKLKGERIVVREGREDVAAIVPLEDLALLEELEEAADLADARAALAEPGPNIPWGKAKRDLGL